MSNTSYDPVADFIANGSGNNLPGFKFRSIGDKVVGTVVRRVVREVNDMNNAGQKINQLIIELKTDEEYTQEYDNIKGEHVVNTGTDWAIWIKSPSQMLSALAEALKAGEAMKGAPVAGDRLACEFVGTEPGKYAGNPKKLYKFAYKAARPEPVTSVDDLL